VVFGGVSIECAMPACEFVRLPRHIPDGANDVCGWEIESGWTHCRPGSLPFAWIPRQVVKAGAIASREKQDSGIDPAIR
jgi:hypothetical protein